MTDCLRESQEQVFHRLAASRHVSVVSPVPDYAKDPRICLTFVYFLKGRLERRLQDVIRQLEEADLRQYYYGKGDLHLTVQNVRNVADPPGFDAADISRLRSLKLPKMRLSVELRGLLTLQGSVVVKGYPDGVTADFIAGLRGKLNEIGVPDDKKYFDPEVMIANVTLCRFYEQATPEFGEVVRRNAQTFYGNAAIDSVSLVSCNAVARKKRVHRSFRISVDDKIHKSQAAWALSTR